MPYVLIILIFNCNIHVTFTGLVAFDQYVLYIIVVVCDARFCVIFSIFDTSGFDTLDIIYAVVLYQNLWVLIILINGNIDRFIK